MRLISRRSIEPRLTIVDWVTIVLCLTVFSLVAMGADEVDATEGHEPVAEITGKDFRAADQRIESFAAFIRRALP